jgi:hypothetical protein
MSSDLKKNMSIDKVAALAVASDKNLEVNGVGNDAFSDMQNPQEEVSRRNMMAPLNSVTSQFEFNMNDEDKAAMK